MLPFGDLIAAVLAQWKASHQFLWDCLAIISQVIMGASAAQKHKLREDMLRASIKSRVNGCRTRCGSQATEMLKQGRSHNSTHKAQETRDANDPSDMSEPNVTERQWAMSVARAECWEHAKQSKSLAHPLQKTLYDPLWDKFIKKWQTTKLRVTTRAYKIVWAPEPGSGTCMTTAQSFRNGTRRVIVDWRQGSHRGHPICRP